VKAARDTLKFALLNLVVAIFADEQPPQQVTITTRGQETAEIVLSSSSAVLTDTNEFVQSARAWLSIAGGTLELTEQSTAGGGNTAVLRMPACSSFG
jgi:hypothetical protein